MQDKKARFLTGEPRIEILAQMALDWDGLNGLCDWLREHRPECLPHCQPDDYLPIKLFPHDRRRGNDAELTDNELLVELAGRKCYDSFGEKAGRRGNAEYIANTQAGEVPHASILYHAKFTFFFAGISRRVTHELIRNYVGADRDEEGCPSQESTRYTEHHGYFVVPPRYLGLDGMRAHFERAMTLAYEEYLGAVRRDMSEHEQVFGEAPKGIARKRILEAASSMLPHQAETSLVWTTNPAAISKLVRERADLAADLEMQRFARRLARVAHARAPNLFSQEHVLRAALATP